MMEDFREHLGDVLVTCLENGMQAPLTLAAVAVNGGVLVFRYTWSVSHEGFDAEMLVEHPEGKGLALPINIMIVDSGGEITGFPCPSLCVPMPQLPRRLRCIPNVCGWVMV